MQGLRHNLRRAPGAGPACRSARSGQHRRWPEHGEACQTRRAIVPLAASISWYLSRHLGWRCAIEHLGENFTPEALFTIADRCNSNMRAEQSQTMAVNAVDQWLCNQRICIFFKR